MKKFFLIAFFGISTAYACLCSAEIAAQPSAIGTPIAESLSAQIASISALNVLANQSLQEIQDNTKAIEATIALDEKSTIELGQLVFELNKKVQLFNIAIKLSALQE